MSPGRKLGAYGLLLAVMVALGAAAGAVAGPIDVGGADDHGHAPAVTADGPGGDHSP